MSIFERIANFIFRIARGDSKKRWLYTPVVAFLFLLFMSLFVIAALSTDRWLNLPSIIYLPWTLIAAIIMLIAGAILVIWTWAQFLRAKGTPVPLNPPQKLIVSGVYACSRNPMLMGIFLLFFGSGIIIGSLSLTFIYTPLLIVLFYFQITKIVEREMELKFGQEYLDYKKRVPRFFPRIGKAS
ncbi:MAG: isoprenylcysteine carboxylmethyltransferase family protein [Dehalococcoidia bacterium]|nr:isoprenylcysteine carboxylmethyltransferase family protein [Dehalococcoidia bacterium]